MKRTKRQESSVIIYFSFYFILSFSLLSFVIFSIVPSIQEIEGIKDKTYATYTDLNSIEKEWLSFWEFKTISNSSDLNTYSKELIQNIDIEFYNKYFVNTWSTNYSEFIELQNKVISQWENYDTYLAKSEEISNLLPIYSEVNMWDNENYLSDFQFIHYIESILKTFNLEYSNDIGVSDLVLLEEFSSVNNKSKLDTNIFYIPLDLELEWVKSDILNFLYFIEHVGNISLSGEDIVLENQDKDKFLYRWNSVSLSQKIILDGIISTSRSEYNIFKNQFIDFESVEFNDFIDSKANRISQSQDLISRIKSDQANDKYGVKVTMRFYVKGVQNLKIINQLEEYISYYASTRGLFNTLKASKDTPESTLLVLDEVIQIQWELEQELKAINISIWSQKDLLETLKLVSQYNEILHKLNGKIWYNYYISNVLNNVSKYQSNTKLAISNPELNLYLKANEKTLAELVKVDNETQQQYENRINNRNNFLTILEIEKNINDKK